MSALAQVTSNPGRASERVMKLPSAEHPITVLPNPNRVTVTVAGLVLADSDKTLVLREANYPPVFYFPRSDVDMTLLARAESISYCPYKGDCNYFDIPAGGHDSRDAVWTYENPYPAVSEIKDYLAFYPSRVDGILQG